MDKRWWPLARRKKAILIEVIINGQTILGPMTGEDLIIISKYSGNPELNLLDGFIGEIRSLEMMVRYES